MLNDQESRTSPVNCFFFGVGDHGGGPSIAEVEFFNRFIGSRPAGDAGYSTCSRFFDAAAQAPNIPVYRGDLHMHAVGCYSVLRDLKDAVRRCERGLQHAARALAINGETDACLRSAWKTTLFNQFHDILPGSCSPDAAEQAIAELGGVQGVCRDASYRALKALSQTLPASTREGEFRIFNTLPFDVTVPLHIEAFKCYNPSAAFRDQDGSEILIQEVLPSVRCSNRRWEFVDTLPARGFKSYCFDVETHVERPDPGAIHFRPADRISVTDKHIGPDGIFASEGPGNKPAPILEAPIRFLVLDDQSDTWGHGVQTYDAVEGAFDPVSSAALSGPVTARLYQQWSYGHSTVQAIYSIYERLPGVYLELAANWTEGRKILKVEIRPAGARSSHLTLQGAGGPIAAQADGRERPLHHWAWVPTP